MSGICHNIRMSRIKGLAGRIDIITTFSDRHGNNASRGRCEIDHQSLSPFFGRYGYIIDHGSGNPCLRIIGFLFDNCGKPVLRLERVPHGIITATHTSADQRPIVPLTHSEQIVQIDSLVSAMKIADAEMHDARFQTGWIVAGFVYLVEALERCARQLGHDDFLQFNRVRTGLSS